MIILGIDPGTTIIGFALIEKIGNQRRIIEFGVITTPSGTSISDKLVLIQSDISELIDIYRPDVVGIEKLFFLRNVTNGIDVAQARGVMMWAFASRGIPVREFTPLQIKQAVTGNGRAKKPQVQKAVAMLFGLSEIPKPDDAADALAIAYITAL